MTMLPPGREMQASALLNVDVLALVADSVICADEDGRILVFNPAAGQSFGYSASEVIGQPVEMLLPERHRGDHARQVHSFASEDGAADRLMGHRREVWGRRKTGDEFPAEAMVSRQMVDGRTILTVVLRDTTERKALEELREAVAREIDHRMRNVLSVIGSLVSLTAASTTTVEDFKEALTGRLKALAATQNALQFDGQRRTDLSELFQAELTQYRTPDGANVTIDLPPLPVAPKAAQILALAVHELATNSAKYGALRDAGGRVTVTSAFQGEGDNRLSIEWLETGGAPVQPPTRKGLGTDLITRLVERALRADVAMDYRPEGLACRITLPRAEVEADI